jgi:phosphoglucosamine mutase
MCRTVVAHGATIGIALDGDGDRVVMADERGRLIDGDRIMAMAALDLKERGNLARDTVVATTMTNMGMEVALRARGIELVRTPVGDRYVVEAMRKGGYNLGGEQSGHIVFLDHTTTGDGLITALQVLSLMIRSQKPISELAFFYEDYPQILRNVAIRKRLPLEEVDGLKAALEKARLALEGKGRVVIRYSGTEPLLRIMVEGERETLIESLATELEEIAIKHLG